MAKQSLIEAFNVKPRKLDAKMVKDYERLISATQNILDYKYDEKEGTC